MPPTLLLRSSRLATIFVLRGWIAGRPGGLAIHLVRLAALVWDDAVRSAVATSLALAVVSVTCAATADPARDEAARLFERGVALLATIPLDRRAAPEHAATLEAALGYFRRSLSASPSFSSRVNAAEALYLLGRRDEAHELYVVLLAEFSTKLVGPLGDTIRARVAEIGAELAPLEVRGEPGATLFVDGQPRGVLPLGAPLFVLPGLRRVASRKDGFEPREQLVQVRKPGLTLDVSLTRSAAVGRVLVSDPAHGDVDVVVDGARVGAAPRALVLSPGRHVVWLDGPVDGSLPRTIDVEAAGETTLSLTSVPMGARRAIVVTPASAAISVDGGSVELAGDPVRWPRAGARLVVSEPGYVTRSLIVSGDDAGSVIVELAVDPAHPRWRRPTPSQLLLGAQLVALVGPGLRGDTAGGTPWGLGAEAQVQLAPRGGVRIELDGGYLALAQRGSRSVAVDDATEARLTDDVAVHGPLLAVGARLPWSVGRWLAAPAINLGVWLPTATNNGTAELGRGDQTAPLSRDDEGIVRRATPFARAEFHVGRRVGALEWTVSLGAFAVPWMGGRWPDREAYVAEGPACATGAELRCVRGTTAASSGRVHRAFAMGLLGVGLAWSP